MLNVSTELRIHSAWPSPLHGQGIEDMPEDRLKTESASTSARPSSSAVSGALAVVGREPRCQPARFRNMTMGK